MIDSSPMIESLPSALSQSRRRRTWPALLVLLFLSPGVGEVISGSTPPLRFIQPFSLIFLPTLYGISAILIREIMVRRHLSWGNALLMGAAFGAFQEALVVQTWFNFMVKSSPSHSVGLYGVLWGTNWDWGLNLNIYHAVVSITVPLVLIELFFPRRTALPWLGRKGAIALTAWLFLLCSLLAIDIAFASFVNEGYSGPPLISYLACVAITVTLFALGAFVRFPAPRADISRHVPRLWSIRFWAFAFMTGFFIVVIVIVPTTSLPAWAGMLGSASVFAFALWRVRRWSARAGWGPRQRLAVVTGVIMYFTFAFGPLVEFGLHLPGSLGLTFTNVLVFIGLLLLDRRLAREGDVSVAGVK